MLDARFKILHVFWGKRLVVQTADCAVDVLVSGPQIAHHKTTLPGEIIEAGFTCSLDRCVLGDEFCGLARRHRNTHEAVSEKTRTANRKLTARGNFHVIENSQ